MTFGSLFAGIGGFDLGLERAGMHCTWQVEIDPYACRVLERHWPHIRRWDDVRTFPPESINDWRVDVIAGGFPCQDISNSGRRAGIDGERSGLWAEFARVIRVLRPRYVLVENVSALLVRGMGRVLGDLAALGYDAEWEVLPACAFGAPHIRERVWILACRRDLVVNSMFGGCHRDDGRGSEEEFADRSWWATEPDVDRVAHGIPARVDRIRALGNAIVPQVAEFIGRLILASVPMESRA